MGTWLLCNMVLHIGYFVWNGLMHTKDDTNVYMQKPQCHCARMHINKQHKVRFSRNWACQPEYHDYIKDGGIGIIHHPSSWEQHVAPPKKHIATHKMPSSIPIPSTQFPSHLIQLPLSYIELHVWCINSLNIFFASFDQVEHLIPISTTLAQLVSMIKESHYPKYVRSMESFGKDFEGLSTLTWFKLQVNSCQSSSTSKVFVFSISSSKDAYTNSISIWMVCAWSTICCFSFITCSTWNLEASSSINASCSNWDTSPTNLKVHSFEINGHLVARDV